MTKADKPVRRETYSSVRERGASLPLIVELHPTFLRVRPKKCRYFFTVTYDQIWNLGAQNEAEAKRRAKAQARKEPRLSKR